MSSVDSKRTVNSVYTHTPSGKVLSRKDQRKERQAAAKEAGFTRSRSASPPSSPTAPTRPLPPTPVSETASEASEPTGPLNRRNALSRSNSAESVKASETVPATTKSFGAQVKQFFSAIPSQVAAFAALVWKSLVNLPTTVRQAWTNYWTGRRTVQTNRALTAELEKMAKIESVSADFLTGKSLKVKKQAFKPKKVSVGLSSTPKAEAPAPKPAPLAPVKLPHSYADAVKSRSASVSSVETPVTPTSEASSVELPLATPASEVSSMNVSVVTVPEAPVAEAPVVTPAPAPVKRSSADALKGSAQ